MADMKSATLLRPAASGRLSSALSSRDSSQTFCAGPGQPDQEQGEDQLADVGVVGGQDLRDPALHPGGEQQPEAGQVDQAEAQQQEVAVAVEPVIGQSPGRCRLGGSIEAG